MVWWWNLHRGIQYLSVLLSSVQDVICRKVSGFVKCFRTPKKGNREESWLSVLYSHWTSLLRYYSYVRNWPHAQSPIGNCSSHYFGLENAWHFRSKKIQERVDASVTPSYVGRIPLKIRSGFSQFTADQWCNWTLLYSLCSLKGIIISHQHYDCWLLFVKATGLLCHGSISMQQVNMADTLSRFARRLKGCIVKSI